jgi:hypothetical protein
LCFEKITFKANQVLLFILYELPISITKTPKIPNPHRKPFPPRIELILRNKDSKGIAIDNSLPEQIENISSIKIRSINEIKENSLSSKIKVVTIKEISLFKQIH